MMQTKTVIGISLGTRAIGFALLSYGDLVLWKTEAFSRAWNTHKHRAIVQSISKKVAHHSVNAIAVKVPDIPYTSQRLNSIIGCINVMGERWDIKPIYYTISELKRKFPAQVCKNKQQLVECVLSTYPDLMPVYKKERRKCTGYYMRIFEAVAAAHLLQK